MCRMTSTTSIFTDFQFLSVQFLDVFLLFIWFVHAFIYYLVMVQTSFSHIFIWIFDPMFFNFPTIFYVVIGSLPYLPGLAFPKASPSPWRRSGSISGGCPSVRGRASSTSVSSPSPATSVRCAKGWWRTWTPTTATTPSSSWVSSSTACKGPRQRRPSLW